MFLYLSESVTYPCVTYDFHTMSISVVYMSANVLTGSGTTVLLIPGVTASVLIILVFRFGG